MNVYTVEECYPYEGCNMRAVFSTREKADAYVDDLVSTRKRYRDDLKITEWLVDAVNVADKETR